MTNEELAQEVAALKEGMLAVYGLTEALSERTKYLGKTIELQSGTLMARVAVSDALLSALLQSRLINPQLFELALKNQIEFQSADLAEEEKHNFETCISSTRHWIDSLK